ncbi:hypothetical protein Tco_1022351, partial [Tanacetum coccineum]
RKDDNSEMSIYDFMNLAFWGDAKHTTAPAYEGALIPLPTPDEAAAAQPDPRLARRSQGHSKGKARISSVIDSTKPTF